MTTGGANPSVVLDYPCAITVPQTSARTVYGAMKGTHEGGEGGDNNDRITSKTNQQSLVPRSSIVRGLIFVPTPTIPIFYGYNSYIRRRVLIC